MDRYSVLGSYAVTGIHDVYIIKIHFEFSVVQRGQLFLFLFSSGAEFRNETIVFRQFGTRI